MGTAIRPFTPYVWCEFRTAKPGDTITSLDATGIATAFTITRIDHESKAVYFSLDGVWTDREWIGMDRNATYELGKKGE